MTRDLLLHLPVVLTVAQRGGFAAASAVLNMSPSAVSHAVRTVEKQLGQPIFMRTTRSVALTEAGKSFIAAIGPALTTLDDSMHRLRSSKAVVSGVLRLNAPRIAMPLALTASIIEMTKRFPDLTIEVTSDERLVDIVASGFDAGVRLGGMIAQDMVAVRLTDPFESILVAAPAYLKKRDAPKNIADLAAHNCIGYRLLASDITYAWDLMDRGRKVAVSVNGSVRVTDPLYAKELALAGIGIAYIFEPIVREELKKGQLQQLLPRASFEEPGLFLYFPRYAADTPKLRAFIDTTRTIVEKRKKD